jgi:hypothetical protein
MLVLIRISLVILAASVIKGPRGLVHFKTITRASILTRPRRNWPTSSRRRRSGVKATPFGNQDGHDPERARVLRPPPARASRSRPMTLDVLIIRVPRVTWFTAHIVLRYGQEGVAVTCACRLARMRTTWARED